MAEGDVKMIRDYFEMTSAEMIREWKALSEEAKAQIREGIKNGSFTY